MKNTVMRARRKKNNAKTSRTFAHIKDVLGNI